MTDPHTGRRGSRPGPDGPSYQPPPGGLWQQPGGRYQQQPEGHYQQQPGGRYQQQPEGHYQQPHWQPPHGGPYQQQPPPRRKRHLGLKITLGIFGGIIVLIFAGVIVAALGGSSTNTPSASTGTQAGPASAGAPASVAPGIGGKVRDGKFEFVVTKITHAKSVGDTSLGLGDTAQGEYTILHVRVTNIGNQAQTLDDSAQFVYDAVGRKFDASSAADIDLAGANGQGNTWFEDINPGNTVRGRIAFERSPSHHKAFHDVTAGNNDVAAGSVTVGYQARPGWDPVTGWGSPNAQVLVRLLARFASRTEA
jgi:hypothetical protein